MDQAEQAATPDLGAELGKKYDRLRAKKAEKLDELMKLTPSAKRYKPTLKEFLEVDADLEKALLKRLGKPAKLLRADGPSDRRPSSPSAV